MNRNKLIITLGTIGLAACAGTVGSKTTPQTRRRSGADQVAIGDDTAGKASPAPTTTTQLGRVTARFTPDPPDPASTTGSTMYIDFSWSDLADPFGETLRREFHNIWHERAAYKACLAENAREVSVFAWSLVAYIQARGPTLQGASQELTLWTELFAAGGIPALEFVTGVIGIMSVADWLLLLGAIGISGWEAFNVVQCAAERTDGW